MKTLKAGRVLLIVAVMLAASTHASAEEDSGSLLPGPDAIEGWNPDGDMLTYGPDNLWEYINGSAETFLMYEFKVVAAMHYLDDSEEEVKVEIYQHGSPLMAYGIYSQFRSPDAEQLDIGAGGFGDEYAIHFWKGDFYVKIDSYSEGAGMKAVMRSFASAVEKKIKGKSEEPREVSLFPGDGLQPSGIVFMTEGVMGSGKLPPAFMASYIFDGEKGKAYLFTLENEEKAVELLKSYSESIGVSTTEKKLDGISCLMAEGEAPYRGRVVAVQKEKWMAVVTGFTETPDKADKLAARLVDRLAEGCGK